MHIRRALQKIRSLIGVAVTIAVAVVVAGVRRCRKASIDLQCVIENMV